MPRVDATYYIYDQWLSGYYGLTVPVRKTPSSSSGESNENPIYVPGYGSLRGIHVELGDVRSWFDNRDDRGHGGWWHYTNGLEVWVTTTRIEATYGRGWGYQIYSYTGKSPDDYIEIHAPEIVPGCSGIDYDLDGLGLIVFVLREQWDYLDDENYEWRMQEVYRSDPVYLGAAPYLVATSTPTDAAVYHGGAYVGNTPCIFTPQVRWGSPVDGEPMSAYAADVQLSFYAPGREPAVVTTTMYWLPYLPRKIVWCGRANADLPLLKCTDPPGEQGDTDCRELDRYRCHLGAWELIEEDSIECGLAKPEAWFSASYGGGSAPAEVRFTDESDGNPRAWFWDFGDGSNSTEQHPRHTYAENGVYTFALTVSNKAGSSTRSASMSIGRACYHESLDPQYRVHGDVTCIEYDYCQCNDGTWEIVEPETPRCGFPVPTPAIQVSYTRGSPPLEVQCRDLSKHARRWTWDFGDGTVSREQHPTHIYTQPGWFCIQLEVANNSGTATSKRLCVGVLHPCANPDGAHGATTCIGYDSVKCDDGTWVTTEEAAPACGYPRPSARFAMQWDPASPPVDVAFTDLSTDFPAAWVWDFGDGTTSTDQHPVHTYADPGTFVVRLEVSNKSGSDQTTKTLSIPHPCATPTGAHGDVTCIEYDYCQCNDGTWEIVEPETPRCGYLAPPDPQPPDVPESPEIPVAAVVGLGIALLVLRRPRQRKKKRS